MDKVFTTVAAWGNVKGNDTTKSALLRLWNLVKWTLFSNDDGE